MMEGGKKSGGKGIHREGVSGEVEWRRRRRRRRVVQHQLLMVIIVSIS